MFIYKKRSESNTRARLIARGNKMPALWPVPKTIVSVRDNEGLSDCLVSVECSVVESHMPGTHRLFIGKAEAVHCDEKYLDGQGNILWDKLELL